MKAPFLEIFGLGNGGGRRGWKFAAVLALVPTVILRNARIVGSGVRAERLGARSADQNRRDNGHKENLHHQYLADQLDRRRRADLKASRSFPHRDAFLNRPNQPLAQILK